MARPPLPLKGLGSKFDSKFSDGVVHKGVDIKPTGSDDVVSPVRGVVKRVFRGSPISAGSNGFGPAFVVIDAFDDGTSHTLAHLSIDELPTEGEEVDEGEFVGRIARGVVPSKFHSGIPHVHWEISRNGSKVDPMSYLATKGIPTSSSSSSGSGNGVVVLLLLLLLASRNAR